MATPPPMITNGGKNGGSSTLTAVILSAYDLPMRDPPLGVQLTLGSKVAKSGPPAQRHKDRNSFKFNRQELVIAGKNLEELYQSTLVVELLYSDNNSSLSPKKPLSAEYKISELRIHETQWLILQLAKETDDDDMVVAPTIRLQLTLEGPYRPEIAVFINAFTTWFAFVDGTIRHLERAVPTNIMTLPDPKYLLLPAAPILALLTVSAPVVIGILTVTLPVALPVMVALFLVLAVGLAGLGILYASSKGGRNLVGTAVAPLVQTVLSTRAGQNFVYPVGPRPTPVSVAGLVVPTGMWGRLVFSLLVDLLGSASYLVPVVGEVTDIGWAPLQTILIMAMYEDTSSILKYVSFVEEFLPFTDIVPTATVGWCLEYGMPLIASVEGSETLLKPLSAIVTNAAASQPASMM